jgi:hypothetical protein
MFLNKGTILSSNCPSLSSYFMNLKKIAAGESARIGELYQAY